MSEKNGNMEDVKEMFNDYEKEKSQGNSGKKFESVLSKIFVPRNSKEYFRILPPNKGEKIIEKGYFHQVQTNTSSGKRWRKVYCLKHNGDKKVQLDQSGNPVVDQQGNKVYVQPRCPLCEKQEEILKKQDKSVKGIKKDDMTPQQKEIFDKNKEIFTQAQKWAAKKFYIISGIDRLAERDGKKFWRFKHNFRNNGVLDKLMPVLSDFVDNNEVNFTDPQKGADCNITVVDAYMPNGKTYKDVSAITMSNQKPLHNDPAVVKQWLEDDVSWRDVFKPASAPVITPEEYLDMVVEEKDPYWDDSNPQNKHWVFPGRPDLEQKAKEAFVPKEGADKTAETDEKIDSLDKKIGNLSPEDSGTYQDNHVDLTASVEKPTQTENQTQNQPETNQQDSKPENGSSEQTNEPQQAFAPNKDEQKQESEPTNDKVDNSTNSEEGDEDFDDLPF